MENHTDKNFENEMETLGPLKRRYNNGKENAKPGSLERKI